MKRKLLIKLIYILTFISSNQYQALASQGFL
jgi:hypothetical protein